MATTKITKITHPTATVSTKPIAVTPPHTNPKTAFAAQMSGYDATSPIWNKQLIEVLDMIDVAAGKNVTEVRTITQELRKRIAKGRLIKAQR